MTTFTTIPNSSLEPGKPIRSIDGIALRDNPLAIIEGDPTAPRIVGKAAKRLADYPVLSVTAADTYSAENGSSPEPLSTTTSSSSEVVAYRYTISKYTGSLRFKTGQIGGSHLGGEVIIFTTSTLRIFKNGTLIQTYTTSGTNIVTRTNDISVVPGDVIEWRHRTSDSSGAVGISNTVVLATNGYTSRPLYIEELDAGTA
jgi:hypothetical protein